MVEASDEEASPLLLLLLALLLMLLRLLLEVDESRLDVYREPDDDEVIELEEKVLALAPSPLGGSSPE
ncbi:hypothetical protein ACSSS7_001471 [Eimeria intestinalis]